jgi:outer membrane biogenesis lipoprotein LolB
MSRDNIDLMAENIHLMQELAGMSKRIDDFNAWLDTLPFENSSLTVHQARQAIAGKQPIAPRKP